MPRNEKLLIDLLNRWQGDCGPLVDTLGPHQRYSLRYFELGRARDLHKKLSVVLWPKIAQQVLESFRVSGSIQRLVNREDGGAAGQVLLSRDGPLWEGLRKEIFEILGEASRDATIQANAYALLSSFDQQLREHGQDRGIPSGVALLFDTEVANALWTAATATRLTPRGALQLSAVAEYLQKNASVTLPPWWESTLALSGYKPKDGREDASTQGDAHKRTGEEPPPTHGNEEPE